MVTRPSSDAPNPSAPSLLQRETPSSGLATTAACSRSTWKRGGASRSLASIATLSRASRPPTRSGWWPELTSAGCSSFRRAEVDRPASSRVTSTSCAGCSRRQTATSFRATRATPTARRSTAVRLRCVSSVERSQTWCRCPDDGCWSPISARSAVPARYRACRRVAHHSGGPYRILPVDGERRFRRQRRPGPSLLDEAGRRRRRFRSRWICGVAAHRFDRTRDFHGFQRDDRRALAGHRRRPPPHEARLAHPGRLSRAVRRLRDQRWTGRAGPCLVAQSGNGSPARRTPVGGERAPHHRGGPRRVRRRRWPRPRGGGRWQRTRGAHRSNDWIFNLFPVGAIACCR